MTIGQFKTFALESMCEAHTWKNGETYDFTLKGWRYTIKKEGRLFHLYTYGAHKAEEFARHDAFKTLPRLFHDIFNMRYISYN